MTEGIKEKAVGIGGITARAASRLAWLLWALSVALTTLSLVLLVLIRSHPGTHVFDFVLSVVPFVHMAYAAYKVNQGVDYRYPLVADLIGGSRRSGTL